LSAGYEAPIEHPNQNQYNPDMMIKGKSCVERSCDLCGSKYYARKDSLKKGMGRYCSKSCQVTQQHISGTNKAAKKGGLHHNWKGGRIKVGEYWKVLMPEHPYCQYNGYVLEHRLVMEKELGRYLAKDEDVHHINFDTLDNRPGNLQVMSRAEHKQLHADIDAMVLFYL